MQGVERRILAPLRDRTFFSFTELNRVLHEKLEEYNARPFQKLEGCRRSLFEEVDRPALRPLPATRYEFAQWRQATVHVDYHVEVDKHRYSVPYRLVKEKVDVRSTQSVVEVFFKGKRVAAHPRSFQKGRFTTVKEHMPKSHREYADWTPERIIRWGRKCGEHVAQLLEQLIAERPHPYQGFRACLGILRLGKHYGNQRLDAACRRALAIKSLGYKSIESILRQGLDQKPLPEQPSQSPAVQHANVRGADYYNHSN